MKELPGLRSVPQVDFVKAVYCGPGTVRGLLICIGLAVWPLKTSASGLRGRRQWKGALLRPALGLGSVWLG